MSKQIGIKEVLNCTISNFSTGAPLCYVDYASDSTITTDAERLDLRGGQGNYKLLSFDHTKSCSFKLEMPLVDMSFLAMLTGKDLRTAAVVLPKREVLTVSASNKVSISATPTGLKVYILDGDRDYGTEQTAGSAAVLNQYSISGYEITLNSTSCPANSKVVCQYDYTAPATTRTTTFTADKFPVYVSIDGIGQVVDQVTGANRVTVFVIKKAKPKNNFSITMKSTEATVLSMDFDLYPVDEDTDSDGVIDKVYLSMSELA